MSKNRDGLACYQCKRPIDNIRESVVQIRLSEPRRVWLHKECFATYRASLHISIVEPEAPAK